jgi:hypothetical protein
MELSFLMKPIMNVAAGGWTGRAERESTEMKTPGTAAINGNELSLVWGGQEVERACSWTQERKGGSTDLSVRFAVSQALYDEAYELDMKVHGMTTEDMGIAQEGQAAADAIQQAIMAGETEKARRLIEGLNLRQGNFYKREWESYHALLLQPSMPFIAFLADSFSQWHRQPEIGSCFASVPHLVVTFVQNLPYGGATGIGVPVYTLASGEVACGSRVYLLYLLFRYLKQNVIILGSQTYNHMMLGWDTAGKGAGVQVNGKKYLFQETTGPGYKPGDVDEGFSDISSWDQFALP